MEEHHNCPPGSCYPPVTTAFSTAHSLQQRIRYHSSLGFGHKTT